MPYLLSFQTALAGKAVVGQGAATGDLPRPAGTASGEPMSLADQILQRQDQTLRAQAVAEARRLLDSSDPASQQRALDTLAKTRDVPYDRQAMVPTLRRLIASSDPSLRRLAVPLLALLGGNGADLPALAALRADTSASVREAVAESVLTLDPQGEQAVTLGTIETLLSDGSEGVRKATVQALWGHAISPQAETRLVEISRGNNSLAYDAVYYGLSTRPVIRRPVAERLIELLSHKDGNVSGRAAWGLSHNSVAQDARELVVQAFIRELDETLQRYVREECIYGLGQLGSAAAKAKLRAVAERSESAKERQAAEEALARLGESPQPAGTHP